jgi:glycerol-3-phosphate dehydrogenase
MPAIALSPEQRQQALHRLRSERFDVLVIGGGVVGTGVAIDAVTRGLSVALVEARDISSGTSSRSSKLVHGGLRYLEMLDFGLVAEALSERGLLIEKLAPHLVRPVPFLYPLRHVGWERLYAGAGVALYDLLATVSGNRGGIPYHRHLSRRGALTLAPSLRRDALTGAIVYYDAQVDDARHTLFLARTAAAYGAAVTTRTRVESLTRESDRVTGAEVRDEESGETFAVSAGVVVNATGVWTGDIETMATGDTDLTVRASKGVHLVIRPERIKSDVGMIMRTEKSVLFLIPWGAHWLVGTTDTDWAHGREHPSSTSTDIDYLIDHVNAVLRIPLTRDDVVGVYVGLRPLITGASSSTAKLSREHAVSHRVPGLVSVAGGKYTTYRVMAKDAVDEAVTDLPAEARGHRSCTHEVPLLGAEGYQALRNQAAQLAAKHALDTETVVRLLGRYGALVEEVLAATTTEPTWTQPLPGAPGYLRAEIVYAATHEGALHLDDVLTRRTRISFEADDRGHVAAVHAADLLASVLGWSESVRTAEIARYHDRLDAEHASQSKAGDAEADAERYRNLRAVGAP